MGLQKILLGKKSKIGYGCLHLSFAEHLNEDQKVDFMVEAYKQGVTLFDTAAAYGENRDNERYVGKFLERIGKENRHKVHILTKCGIDFSDMSFPQSPDEIRSSLQESLSESCLNTDYVDILLLHRIDPNVAEEKFEAAIKALKSLVREGKVKHVGLSECTAAQIKIASEIDAEIPIKYIEIAYSLFTQRAETNGVKDACEKLDVGIIAYTSANRGFTSNAILESFTLEEIDETSPEYLRSKTLKVLGIEDNIFENTVGYYDLDKIKVNLRAMLEFQKIAKDLQCTPTQLSLAWIQHQGVVPIPATTNQDHLQENIDSSTIDLRPVVLNKLEKIASLFKGNPNPSILDVLENKDLETGQPISQQKENFI